MNQENSDRVWREMSVPKWNHIFLALALAEFFMGISVVRPTTLFVPGLGLFLMAQKLDRESALLDEQNRAVVLDQHEPVWQPGSPKNSQYEVATHPVPAIAQIY
jgi:hypothetical protein